MISENWVVGKPFQFAGLCSKSIEVPHWRIWSARDLRDEGWHRNASESSASCRPTPSLPTFVNLNNDTRCLTEASCVTISVLNEDWCLFIFQKWKHQKQRTFFRCGLVCAWLVTGLTTSLNFWFHRFCAPVCTR